VSLADSEEARGGGLRREVALRRSQKFVADHEFSHGGRAQKRREIVRVDMPGFERLPVGRSLMKTHGIRKSRFKKIFVTNGDAAKDVAKEIALVRMYNQRALRYMLPWLPRDIDEIFEFFDGDPWPYGVEENRPTLEALVQYLQDQHLTDWKPTLEELFAPIYGLE